MELGKLLRRLGMLVRKRIMEVFPGRNDDMGNIAVI